jgi:hypothetical protein
MMKDLFSNLFSHLLFWQGFVVGASFIVGGCGSWHFTRSWARRRAIHRLLSHGQISVNEARTLLQIDRTLRFYQSVDPVEPPKDVKVCTSFPPETQ